jgi:hypothetical protein
MATKWKEVSLDEFRKNEFPLHSNLEVIQKASLSSEGFTLGKKPKYAVTLKLSGIIDGDIKILSDEIWIEFKDLVITGNLILGSDEADAENLTVYKVLFSKNVTIKGDLVFSQNSTISGNVEIEDSTVEGEIVLNEQEIRKKFRFRNCLLEKKLFFNNTTFRDLVDFYGTTFEKPVNFFKCNFEGATVFSDAKFKGNLLFTFSEFKSHLIFRETKFLNNSGLDLATSIIIGKVYFQHVEMGYFAISKEDINDAYRDYQDAGEISGKNRRDTFRIIKKYAKDNEDYYEVSEFGYLEAKAKHEMLDWEIQEKKAYPKVSDKSLSQLKQDRWIHKLNNWSNRYKASWLQSIGYILLVSLASYLIIVPLGWIGAFDSSKFRDWSCIEEYLILFFNLLNPLHNLDIYKDIPSFDINIGVVIFDLFSRIFVGYGYYQFVQAFRRFK